VKPVGELGLIHVVGVAAGHGQALAPAAFRRFEASLDVPAGSQRCQRGPAIDDDVFCVSRLQRLVS